MQDNLLDALETLLVTVLIYCKNRGLEPYDEDLEAYEILKNAINNGALREENNND